MIEVEDASYCPQCGRAMARASPSGNRTSRRCSACAGVQDEVAAIMATLARRRRKLTGHLLAMPPEQRAEALEHSGGTYLEAIVTAETLMHTQGLAAGPPPEPDDASRALLVAWRSKKRH